MELKRPGFYLMMSIVVFIIISGCIGNEEQNKTSLGTPAFGHNQTSTLTPVLTPMPNQTQPVPNDSYWIHIDPVGNKSAGEIILINGTTNLNISADILIEVGSADWDPRSKTSCGECVERYWNEGTFSVVEGSQKNIHIFNGSIDSSHSACKGLVFKPQEYTAKAKSFSGNYIIEEQVNFTLMPSNISANVTYGKNGC
jgi:hypothetical protein